jgi:hypothetical protein
MIHPITAEEMAALNALLAGARTAGEVAARTSRNAWAVLRGMELREPALAYAQRDHALGEVWSPTLLGIAAVETGEHGGRRGEEGSGEGG